MNTRTTARARELEVLKCIGVNGWMLTRHIGLWVWNTSTEHTSINKAQLVLKRLLAMKYVARRETLNGISAWILTKNGADFVNACLIAEGYERGWAHHGYDTGMLDYEHILTGVSYLTAKMREVGVAGAVGRAGLRAGLVPALAECDGVYFKKAKTGGYILVGVLAVTNAREGVQNKLKKLLADKHNIDLAGDARIIATLRKRITV